MIAAILHSGKAERRVPPIGHAHHQGAPHANREGWMKNIAFYIRSVMRPGLGARLDTLRANA